jgi:hypothetical protein
MTTAARVGFDGRYVRHAPGNRTSMIRLAAVDDAAVDDAAVDDAAVDDAAVRAAR